MLCYIICISFLICILVFYFSIIIIASILTVGSIWMFIFLGRVAEILQVKLVTGGAGAIVFIFIII